jgi:serine/threonine-protein kinase
MPAAGDTFGPYRVLRLIGHGATSTVFEAMDEHGARLALKILHEEHRGCADLRERFVQEALPLLKEQLRHPALPRILAIEQHPGCPYIAMELLGPSLAARLRQGPLPFPEAIRAVADVAGALAYLHARQIIHRDVKPGNVLTPRPGTSGPCKLIDLGLAKLPAALRAGSEVQLSTAAGDRCGTPEYRAPEQWQCAKAVSDRADVYGLGVLLYESLSGAPPFRGESLGRLRLEHTLRPPPPLDAPAPVQALARAMLAKAAQARPSAAEVATTLASLLPAPR